MISFGLDVALRRNPLEAKGGSRLAMGGLVAKGRTILRMDGEIGLLGG